MRRRSLAILAVAMTLSLGPRAAFGHSGDLSFLDLDYDMPHALELEASAGTPALDQHIAHLANQLSTLENIHGETVLPAGCTCESAAMTDGVLTVRIDLPEDLTEIDIFRVETAHEVLRHFFQEADTLREIRVLARNADSDVWRPLSDWAPQPPPVVSVGEDDFEIGGPGPQPSPDYSPAASLGAGTHNIAGQGGLGTTGAQFGALAGRTVFLGAGHGWTWSGSNWFLQRPLLLSMNEDHGNIDQFQFTARYLFNAGATVVTMRPIDNQPNEVVIDDSDVAVTLSPPGIGADANTGWVQSANPNYYIGGTPYIFTNATPTETRTATFTPNIPEEGFYPVYCWANYGSDRISGQLYRIHHTGGSTEIRVNHRRVGRGWVWLGSYHFNAGSNSATGSVVISNDAPASGTTTGVVIADAIRFGNGIGDVNRGGGVSGFARETENSRYWAQRMISDGTPTSVYDGGGDDQSDNVGTPPRMAAEMRRDDGQGYNGDIYLGYHSNAFNGTARGNVALITNSGGTPTNQAAYATLVADEHDLDCLVEDANWENVWIDRVSATLTSAYGEISNGNLGGEMCGTIIEVAFHDNALDAELLRDPKVRNVMGRSHYQAILQYFNQFDSASLVYLPEPPVNFRAINQGNGDITLSWSPGPSGQPGGDAATGYRVYVSTDGLGFTLHSTTAGTSATLTGLPADQPHYFRVTATNAGGESLPTESLAARVQSGSPAPTLIVNGYDRIDRNNNIEEYPANLEDDENERIHLHRNNSYNYVIAHAEAIDAFGRNFDSCANEAVITGAVDLTDYDTVVWILGEESTTDSTFNPTEQTQVTNFLNGGGNLFLTGAEIGWDLDAQGNGVSFFENTLHANYVGDDGGTYAAGGAVGSIFEGIALSFDDGTFVYDVDFPDRLVANGAGATVAMNYIGGTNDGAAIQFSGGSPTRRVVMLGFPFETIIDVTDRNAVMAAVLDFFGTPVPVGISLIGVE